MRNNVVIVTAPRVVPPDEDETELPVMTGDTLAPASQVSIKQTPERRKAKPQAR